MAMIIFDFKGKIIPEVYNDVGVEIATAYTTDGVALPASGFIIKVMEYNVGQWYTGNHVYVPVEKYDSYRNLQEGMISNADADIAFLCEYSTDFNVGHSAKSMLEDYFPYIIEYTKPYVDGQNINGWQFAICSKYPLSSFEYHKYANNQTPYYASCGMVVNGVPIRLVITHLDWDQAELRAEETSILLDYLDQFPNFILAGDFNILASSTATTDFKNVIQPMLDKGYQVANANGDRFLPTYNNGWDGYLDNIVASDNMSLSNVYVDQTKKNDAIDDKIDHMPLLATITVN